MNRSKLYVVVAACVVLATLANPVIAQETSSAIAGQGNASAFSAAQLAERAIDRRAVETVIWGMPVVIQKDRPADTSNWLPAPSDEFNLTMGLYGPQTPILDDSYRLPAASHSKTTRSYSSRERLLPCGPR
jgi:hypothetical protein